VNLQSNVVFFKTNLNQEAFEQVTKVIKEFSSQSNYAFFINNNSVFDEPTIRSWLDLEQLIDYKSSETMPEKVIMFQLKGFNDEDAKKINQIIADAVMDYSIKVLIVNDPLKPVTMSEFIDDLAKMLGVLNDVRERRKSEIPKEITYRTSRRPKKTSKKTSRRKQ